MNNFLNRLMYGKSNKPDYTKEDIQSESRIKLFFDILSSQFGQFVKINLLLFVCMLPLIAWTWISLSVISVDSTIQERATNAVFYAVGLIPCLLILAAPLAGITYIVKNYTQDKHVWLWKDFVSHSKSNAKQALLYMLIYGIFALFGQIVLYGYTVVMQASNFTSIFRGMFMVIYFLILISIIYAFPMMVTYDLKLKHIIKNSLLLTIGSLKSTILAPLLVLLPFILLIFLYQVWPYALIVLTFYSLLFGLVLGLYIITSFTTVVFEKHMNKPDEDEADETSEQG